MVWLSDPCTLPISIDAHVPDVRLFILTSPGGTSGAVAKITGSIGDGFAMLTMDDEFQAKRKKAALRSQTSAGHVSAGGEVVISAGR